MRQDYRVAIIGFGYIGSVIGSVLAEKGVHVTGIEQNPRIINAVQQAKTPFSEPGLDELIKRTTQSGNLSVSDDLETVRDCNVFIITVGTPLSENYEPDISQISQATQSITPYINDDSIVIIKSTVPPFTTQNVVYPILKQKASVKLAFSPERLAEGKAIEEFRAIPIVVGGVNEESTKAVAAFWREVMGNEIIEVDNSVSAEMVKLADNLWIDVNIALAGELAKLSDQLGSDVLQIIRAANSLPKGSSHVNILTPSVGVGGYCLTKDPWFVQSMGDKYGVELRLPKAGRIVNDSMPEYSASAIDAILCEDGEKRENKKIAVLGIAFKNNTGDCRFTPTRPAIEKLIKLGYQVEICDPWTQEHDDRMVTDRTVSKDIEGTMQGACCVAFLAGHDDFRRLPIQKIAELAEPHALIFDGRMFFSRDEIAEMHRYGLRYKGVGRQ